jgi:hypothetical protein
MTEHCDVGSLWRAARQGKAPSQATSQHVAKCEACRTVWEVIQLFSSAPEASLAHAPSGWIQRAIALGPSTSRVRKLLNLVAELSFDSWVTPQAAVLRGEQGELSRRLNWKTDTLEVDLRAESTPNGWDCTAQVLHAGEAAPGVELKSGSVLVHTDTAGLASWSSARPPRTIRIQHQDNLVSLGPISWKRPRIS